MPQLTYQDITGVFVETRGTLEGIMFRRTGCRETAQDLTQDLFFKLERLGERFATYNDARCFLIRMAVNAAIDYHRVARRRAELLADMAPAEDEIDVERELDSRRMMGRVAAALADLPPKCGDVLYLSRIEGLTHREIAHRLSVSRSLVDKYAVRALLHCRATLARDDLPPAAQIPTRRRPGEVGDIRGRISDEYQAAAHP